MIVYPIWVTGSDTSSVAPRARTELTIVQNVVELEFELSRMQMKQPIVPLKKTSIT